MPHSTTVPTETDALPKGGHSADLTGKTALVAGGSRGIGAAIARRLGAAGANVALAY
jgi:3-oxoacyl-ACP reductase-like protein